MENLENSYGFSEFKEEMRALRDKELSGELKTAHFLPEGGVEFDPEKLSEEDFEAWKKIRDGSMSMEDFVNYKDGFFANGLAEGKSEEELSGSPRGMFVRFMANKANEVINAELIKQMRETGE